MVEKYTKTTVGYVTQTFEKKIISNPTDVGNKEAFVCTSQEFIAGDIVDREVDGEDVDVDTSIEMYQNMDMRSPEHGDTVDDRWSLTDVQDRYRDMHEDDDGYEPLSDDVARRIIHLCMDKMDANIGINWEVIDYWTDEVLNPDSRVNE